MQSTPPTCCPHAIILPRSTKKHTHSISTKPFEAATCSDGLCVQLYNSTKKETNTMNFVFYTPTVVFSAQKKFISATVRLSPAESNSKGVFRRDLYHNVEFLSISTLAFCIHTLSTTKNITSNKNFILKYFRCRDGKRTETRIGMEGICITHSCIPLYTVYMQHIMAHSGGMQEWVIQIPSIPILVSVLFPSLHLKYFRIKFLLLVCIVFMRMRTKPHPHPVIS